MSLEHLFDAELQYRGDALVGGDPRVRKRRVRASGR